MSTHFCKKAINRFFFEFLLLNFDLARFPPIPARSLPLRHAKIEHGRTEPQIGGRVQGIGKDTGGGGAGEYQERL